MVNYEPTQLEVEHVARTTVDVLATAGFQSCFVGSMACSRYGLARVPNDIDMVVLTSDATAEELKDLLVRNNSCFYLVRSKDPFAKYRVLWFNLSPTLSSSYKDIFGHFHACKVDTLLPGIMNIPSVPQNLIVRLRGLPLMPMIPLLLLKLQAWSDHETSSKLHLRQKQPVDVRDIDRLLILAVAQGAKLSTESWLPESFVETAKRRVLTYGQAFPGSRRHWRKLGFETHLKTFG